MSRNKLANVLPIFTCIMVHIFNIVHLLPAYGIILVAVLIYAHHRNNSPIRRSEGKINLK